MQGVFLIIKEEGAGRKGIFKGIEASILREAVYSSLKFGMYEPIKRMMGETDPRTTPMWKKFASGGLAGLLCSVMANPTDIIKVRM